MNVFLLVLSPYLWIPSTPSPLGRRRTYLHFQICIFHIDLSASGFNISDVSHDTFCFIMNYEFLSRFTPSLRLSLHLFLSLSLHLTLYSSLSLSLSLALFIHLSFTHTLYSSLSISLHPSFFISLLSLLLILPYCLIPIPHTRLMSLSVLTGEGDLSFQSHFNK